MKKSTKGLKLQRIAFAKGYSLPSQEKERPEKTGIFDKSSSCCSLLEIPNSPLQAMEFLSRSWSPSASDFIQILTPKSLSPQLFDGEIEEHDQRLKDQETYRNKVVCRSQTDKNWTCLSKGKPETPGYEKCKPSWSNWKKIGHVKPWLGGDLLSRISRGSREKRKEELRLHVAQVHATLSVTELAAAVAGIVANSSLEQSNNCNNENMSNSNGWDISMNTAVASAATLIATVCAEAAETLGANRSHIASVINSGLTTQTAAHILTLTATAATCLRGQAILKQRATASQYVSQYQEMLARGSQLPISTQSGKVQLKMVWVYLKHGKLILRMGKKHLWGTHTTSKEYRITYSMEGKNEGGFTKGMHAFLLDLGTTGGTVRVLFEDETQYIVWKSAISNLLLNHIG